MGGQGEEDEEEEEDDDEVVEKEDRKVLKFVKISSQKRWVYDNSQKKVFNRPGVLTMPALKYCISRGSFSEMFDSLAIITSFGGLRTRAPTDARNNRL